MSEMVGWKNISFQMIDGSKREKVFIDCKRVSRASLPLAGVQLSLSLSSSFCLLPPNRGEKRDKGREGKEAKEGRTFFYSSFWRQFTPEMCLDPFFSKMKASYAQD